MLSQKKKRTIILQSRITSTSCRGFAICYLHTNLTLPLFSTNSFSSCIILDYWMVVKKMSLLYRANNMLWASVCSVIIIFAASQIWIYWGGCPDDCWLIYVMREGMRMIVLTPGTSTQSHAISKFKSPN